MNQSKIAALLAASFVLGTGGVLLAQTGAKKVSPPSDTTGSGKDTGMNIPSGISGGTPGGASAGTGTAKTTGSSSKKKSAKHAKKKAMAQ